MDAVPFHLEVFIHLIRSQELQSDERKRMKVTLVEFTKEAIKRLESEKIENNKSKYNVYTFDCKVLFSYYKTLKL